MPGASSSNWPTSWARHAKVKRVTEDLSPVALEVVRRFVTIVEIERVINGLDADARRGVRQELVRPLVTALHDWLQAERALRGVALGRKAWLFAGSSRGDDRATLMYSLIFTAKMNDVDPQAWLADVLARMPSIIVSRFPELLP